MSERRRETTNNGKSIEPERFRLEVVREYVEGGTSKKKFHERKFKMTEGRERVATR